MYEISPNKSFASQYDVGKGEAQVQDLGIAQRAIEHGIAYKHADQVAREKRTADLIDEAAKFDSSNLKPNDIPEFAKKQNELSTWLTDKIGTGGELSVADRIEFNRRKAEIKTGALNSAAAKTYAQEMLKKVSTEPEGTYDEEDIAKIKDFLAHPDNAGKYDVSNVALNKKFNFGQYVSKVLAPAADRQAANQPVGSRKVITPEQAADFITRDLVGEKFRAVSKEMEADKKAGLLPADYNDVNEYAVKKYSPELIQNAPMFAPHYERVPNTGWGSTAQKSMQNVVYDPNTGELSHKTGTVGEKALETDVTIPNPNTGEPESKRIKDIKPVFNAEGTAIIGGSYIETPTETQKIANHDIEVENKANEKARKADYRWTKTEPKREDYVGTFQSKESDEKDYQKALAKYKLDRKAVEEMFPIQDVPYPEKVIKTDDPILIDGLYFQTWGKKPMDVLKNQGGEGLNFRRLPKKGEKEAAGSFPLPAGKPQRGKKNGKWYVWDATTGNYIAE